MGRLGTVLLVYAHPDDESFGVAGTAMRLADAGHRTALLTLTRGDVGMWSGKARAFECHKTQFKDRDWFYEFLKRREGREFFHLAIDRGASLPPSGDLLA